QRQRRARGLGRRPRAPARHGGAGVLAVRPRRGHGGRGRQQWHRARAGDRKGGGAIPRWRRRRRLLALRRGALHGAVAARETLGSSAQDFGQNAGERVLGIVYTIPILSLRTRQPTRRGHPPTPPRRVNVGQSEPSDPPVFPLPDTGGSIFEGIRVGFGAAAKAAGVQLQALTEIPRLVSISVQIAA